MEGTRITIDGHVRSASRVVTAALSGRQAAVVRYAVGFDETYTDHAGRIASRRVRLGSVEVSGDLIVETPRGAVRVPAGSFLFEAANEHLEPLAGSSRFPEELEPLTRGRTEAWLVAESVVAVGDPVQLAATVRPVSDAEVAYEVVPRTGSSLRDRSLDDLAGDLERMGAGRRPGRALLVGLGLVFGLALLSIVGMTIAGVLEAAY